MVIRPQNIDRVTARSAFTLLEVLIVVAILVVLASVSSVFVFRYLDDARKSRCISDVQVLTRAAQAYEIAYGTRPESLQQLVQPPSGNKGYVEASSLLDPWNKQYQYDPTGPRNGGIKPDVWTTSEDGQEIGNWPATAGG